MKTRVPFRLIALGAALLASLSVSLRADIATVAQRKPATDFTRPDQKGAPVKLSSYKGKVVLLDFWATWCAGCKVEIPWYMEFHKKYSARGFAAVGVALDDEGWQTVKPYLVEHPISYPTVVGDLKFAQQFGVTAALPVTLLIDRNGRVAETHVGMVDKDAFEKDILRLLQEKQAK